LEIIDSSILNITLQYKKPSYALHRNKPNTSIL
jgi:hypothetical protein